VDNVAEVVSMSKADKWRLWTSIVLLVFSIVMVWPTMNWFSLSPEKRDKAEASVQPETENPHLRNLLEEIQQGDSTEYYQELYAQSDGVIKLGLDLQGGMYLSYMVEPTAELNTEEAVDQALEVIRNRIDEFGVSEPSITKQGDDRIVVQLPGVRDPARARSIVERQALLEFKLIVYPTEERAIPGSIGVISDIDNYVTRSDAPEDNTETISSDSTEIMSEDTNSVATDTPDEITLDLTPDSAQENTPIDLSETAESDDMSIDLPTPERQGSLSSYITIAPSDIIQRTKNISPGDWVVYAGEDMDRLLAIINTPDVDSLLAQENLEFVFSKEDTVGQDRLRALYLVPRDMGRGWERNQGAVRENYYLTGANLSNVRIQMGGSQSISRNPYLILEFDSEGRDNWEKITGENVNERVAIILDGTVYSAATIKERISGSGTRLSGGFSTEESRDLRLILNAGSLPASLVIAEEQTIGPSLGQQAINKGMLAGIVALTLIAAFIIIYYTAGGVVAILALIFDMLIIMGVLCFPGPLAKLGMTGLNATLTLPGIAGIILTIGMAVDASVLIYERIREEKRAGKGIRAAVKAGYSRAFVTILDANLTTLITALVLYRFGTGPIKGFAVTLSIGILASMFCSLVFTRIVIDLILKNPKKTSFGLGKLAFLQDKHFKFVEMRKKAYLISVIVILIGAGAYFINGGLNLSIDFTGGLETNVISMTEVTSSELKTLLSDAGLEGVHIQELMDYQGEGKGAFIIRTSEEDKSLVYSALATANCQPMEQTEDSEDLSYIKQIGPRVGEELRGKAANAIAMAMFFIILYVWYRFQLKWGIAAVAALLHDILITLGILAIIQMNVSLVIIAALLTIVGYSINDTIVVFDRIREDRRKRRGKNLAETVNISINEVLNRTVITSLTTFMATLILFLISGGLLADFAFTLMIGVIIGTYSSIFVASPILVDWHARLKKK